MELQTPAVDEQSGGEGNHCGDGGDEAVLRARTAAVSASFAEQSVDKEVVEGKRAKDHASQRADSWDEMSIRRSTGVSGAKGRTEGYVDQSRLALGECVRILENGSES